VVRKDSACQGFARSVTIVACGSEVVSFTTTGFCDLPGWPAWLGLAFTAGKRGGTTRSLQLPLAGLAASRATAHCRRRSSGSRDRTVASSRLFDHLLLLACRHRELERCDCPSCSLQSECGFHRSGMYFYGHHGGRSLVSWARSIFAGRTTVWAARDHHSPTA